MREAIQKMNVKDPEVPLRILNVLPVVKIQLEVDQILVVPIHLRQDPSPRHRHK